MIGSYVLRSRLARLLPYVWPVILTVFILLTEPPAYALFLMAATALHETGHLFAFLCCGEPLPRFGGRSFGLLLTPQGDTLSPQHELIICAAGPLFNLAACLALLPALHTGVAYEANFCFFALNLLTALFNLLPLAGFDGGRMLSATLSLTCKPPLARALCAALSLSGALFFYFTALFLSFVAGAGIYPFALAGFLMWNEGKRWPTLWEDF
jgi:Zn-dependent protease